MSNIFKLKKIEIFRKLNSRILQVLGFVFSTLFIIMGVWIFNQQTLAQSTPQLSNFEKRQVTFDESMEDKPSPKISKNWNFLGVGNAYNENEVSLWFKTPDGQIVTINGFFEEPSSDITSSDFNSSNFILEETIQYISVE